MEELFKWFFNHGILADEVIISFMLVGLYLAIMLTYRKEIKKFFIRSARMILRETFLRLVAFQEAVDVYRTFMRTYKRNK